METEQVRKEKGAEPDGVLAGKPGTRWGAAQEPPAVAEDSDLVWAGDATRGRVAAGYRRGCGQGYGRGMGFGHWGAPSREQQVDALQAQSEQLEAQLKVVREQIQTLSSDPGEQS